MSGFRSGRRRAEINQVIGPVKWTGGGGAVGAGAGAGLGIIASGAAFQYAREAFPEALILKLGMTWPLPVRLIKKFAESVTKLAVVEELDPFIEDAVKAAGVRVDYGKNVLPWRASFPGKSCLLRSLVRSRTRYRREGWRGVGRNVGTGKAPVPVSVTGPGPSQTRFRTRRRPSLAPADVLSGMFAQGPLRRALKAKSLRLGRYRLLYIGGAGSVRGYPFRRLHGREHPDGARHIQGAEAQGISSKPVAVIGDSTFLHSGITGIINLAYNGGDAIIVIMNNDTTGMTGGQEHPGTGRNAVGEPSPKVDIQELCRACGLRVEDRCIRHKGP